MFFMSTVVRHMRIVHDIILPWQTLSGLAWLCAGIFIAPGSIRLNDWRLYMVLLAVVLARTSGMVWNRWLDRHFDSQNPRTAARAIPSGRISPVQAFLYAVVTLTLFLLTCLTFSITGQCVGLIIAVAVVVYSLLKRVSLACHFFLGMIYGMLPLVGSLWLSNQISAAVCALSLSAAASIAGTDILYAMQDEVVDRQMQLRSVPASLGAQAALRFAVMLHVVACASLVCAIVFSRGSLVSFAVVSCAIGILWLKWKPHMFPFFLLFFPITSFLATGIDRLCLELW